MPSKDRNEGADSGVAMSAGNANQDLQPIRFGSAESEAQVRGLLSKVDTMRVRVSLADEQDVEGHLFSGGDQTLVLALQVADDDVEGHAISIHFPDAEQARRFRNELLAAGVLTATLAMGVGTGVALAPHQTGTAAAPASQATVFMDTSAQAREGGALTQSRTLSIPVGSASDVAQKAQAAESGLTGPALKSAVGSQSKGAAAVNPAAAADAARTQAGITGSLAGTPTVDTSTKAREGGALSESTVNPAAAADAARTQAGITGSLAGSTSAAEKPAIPQGSAPVPAAQQISDEIAAARGAAQAGAAASASIPLLRTRSMPRSQRLAARLRPARRPQRRSRRGLRPCLLRTRSMPKSQRLALLPPRLPTPRPRLARAAPWARPGSTRWQRPTPHARRRASPAASPARRRETPQPRPAKAAP
ncbi:MAG: hypothetical protein E6J39_00685 [Chloroflexi bacterium]|nr:MAG: hypothetical protein E6J39_00685 [Chloroflexota bacterium]